MSNLYKLEFVSSAISGIFSDQLALGATGHHAIICSNEDGGYKTLVGAASSAGQTQCCGATGVRFPSGYLNAGYYDGGLFVELFDKLKKSTMVLSYQAYSTLSGLLEESAKKFNKKYAGIFELVYKEFGEPTTSDYTVFISIKAVEKDWVVVGEQVKKLVHHIEDSEE